MTLGRPSLERFEVGGRGLWVDRALRATGVVVAFTERGGGVSASPFASLNLSDHVGDDLSAVDENRRLVLSDLGLEAVRDRLTTASMVHGTEVAIVDAASAGSGAFATGGPAPIAGVDAMLTGVPRVPLMACSADCVGMVLVAPGPVVAVVHAGWRGALASIAREAVASLSAHAGVGASEVLAYLGPHIGACHYAVDAALMARFVRNFGSVAQAESGGLDLGAVVVVSLTSAGVDPSNIARVGFCTAESPERFFSYRAQAGLTGRHAAIACIL